MRVVYDAASQIDAHLVRHALEAEEIPVFLMGEALLGGMGELPLFGVVQVCVPDVTWPRARSIVEALALGDPPVPDQVPDPVPDPVVDDRSDPGLLPA